MVGKLFKVVPWTGSNKYIHASQANTHTHTHTHVARCGGYLGIPSTHPLAKASKFCHGFLLLQVYRVGKGISRTCPYAATQRPCFKRSLISALRCFKSWKPGTDMNIYELSTSSPNHRQPAGNSSLGESIRFAIQSFQVGELQPAVDIPTGHNRLVLPSVADAFRTRPAGPRAEHGAARDGHCASPLTAETALLAVAVAMWPAWLRRSVGRAHDSEATVGMHRPCGTRVQDGSMRSWWSAQVQGTGSSQC